MKTNFIKYFAMRLNIRSDRLIGDVQKEFNEMFPFLKIEFFRNRFAQQPDFPLQNLLPHYRRIAAGQMAITEGGLEINPDMTVKDVENIFKNNFLLAAQVFRRSENTWLETTLTDSWTLRHQNEHGKEISNGKIIKDNPEDLD